MPAANRLQEVLNSLVFLGGDENGHVNGQANTPALTSTEQDQVRDMITLLYNGSDRMRAYFHFNLDTPGHRGGVITFTGIADDIAQVARVGGEHFVRLNFQRMENYYVFTETGELVKHTPELILAHELYHYLSGFGDIGRDENDSYSEALWNEAGYVDFAGPTVGFTNDVAGDLGGVFADSTRASYIGDVEANRPGSAYPQFQLNHSYTFGHTVNNVYRADRFVDKADTILWADKVVASDDLIFGLEGEDHIDAGMGRDYLYGGQGEDVLIGGGGDDYLDGGAENDILNGEAGNDTFEGGGGYDEVLHQGGMVSIGLHGGSAHGDGFALVRPGGETDWLFNVEKLTLSADNDTLKVAGRIDRSNLALVIDGDAEEENGKDTLDLSDLDGGILFDRGRIVGSSGNLISRFIDSRTDSNISFVGFERFVFGEGFDGVRLDVINAEIYLGGGGDVLVSAGSGSQVWTGDGKDIIGLSNNVRIMDASRTDVIVGVEGDVIHGGVRNVKSSSAWTDRTKAYSFAYNVEGDLAVRNNVTGETMFIKGYQADFELGKTGLGGLYVVQVEMGAYRVIDEKPSHLTFLGTFEFFLGHYLKAHHGVSMWAGVDPLVLDLDGDGLELTGASGYTPFFDYDGDGYGERGGWVSGDDGFLILDADADGRVTDVGEMFGGPGQSGFAELATHDLNADGVIDASDAVFAQLSVWRDLNGNRVVDDGELVSLTELGIASISVNGVAGAATINGNAVLASGSFTRQDGTNGAVGDVGFEVDQQDSRWMGEVTVSAAAGGLPDLRGVGSLTSLRVAMTLEPGLQAVVAGVLPQLDTLDLTAMRAAALPLFTAWAEASPLLSATPASAHEDVPILTEYVDGQRTVTDYAYWAFNDTLDIFTWHSARSGQPVILQSSPEPDEAPGWSILEGGWIDFFERYLGEPLPLGGEPAGDRATAAGGMQSVVAGMWQAIDLLVVRLAVQGPLSEYFEGLEYDVATDAFHPTTDRQLIPVFEAIFEEASLLGTGGLARVEMWKDVLDVVIGDYRQPEGTLNTNGFLFSNIVAAYESVGLTFDIVELAGRLGLPADLIRTGTGVVQGGDDADLFYLSAGDQVLIGGLGPDTYVVGHGFGHDVIDDEEGVLETHSEDVIRFADIASTEVTATREGLDLILRIDGTNDELRVVDHFDGRLPGFGGDGDLSSSTGVDYIHFADGVEWGAFEIARAVSRSTAGDDTLLGTETIDWFDSGAGNDFLSGGNDADVYVYGHGYGHDTVSDRNGHIYLGGPDYISFIDGITLEDLHFSRNGTSDDLIITVEGQAGSLTLINQFAATYTGVFGTYWLDQIEGFLFQGGGGVGWRDVTTLLLQQASTSGDDAIYGFSLEDRLDGGVGDDFLSGGNENDTYVFGRGYGHDTIHEQWSNILSGGVDEVEFREDTAPGDVAFTRDGDDLIVTITATGDTLRIRDQYVVTETGTLGTHAFNQVEHFRFADGTVLNWPDIRTAIIEASQTPGDDLVLGTHFDDVFEGGEGDDRIEGGNGGDTYRFNVGDGADTIRDHLDNLFTDRADRIVFGEGISADDIVISRYGSENNSVKLSIGATGDSVLIEQQFAYTTIALKEYEVELFEFHDGTIWTANDLRLHAIAQAQTAGNDTVLGFWTNDQINGGAGDDVLRGGDGSDTYTFELGFGVDAVREGVDNVSYADNDAIVFGAGLVSTDAIFTRNGNDLTISFAGLSDQVTIFGQFETQAFYSGWRDIETITFGDAVVMTLDDMRLMLLAQSSTSGDDVITGFSSVADLITGGAGNDTLRGLGGGDTYGFGYGAGQDVIEESIGSLYENQADTVRFDATVEREDVTFTRDGVDLVITLAGATDSIRIVGQFGSSGYAAVERFEFETGLVLTRAEVSLIALANQSTPGDDVITGTTGSDVIAGGAGDDTLRGDDGADTYYFEAGFGSDVIDETVDNVSISDFDVIEFGPGLLAEDASIARDGDDLIISFTSGDTIRVLRQFYHMAYFEGWEDVEEVRFADGQVWTQAYIRERLLAQASTSGDDAVTGYWNADVFDAGAGNDTVHGMGGDDTYLFGFGSGHDTIRETFQTYEGANDTIAFKTGVSQADVSFTRVGNNLVATLGGGQDSVTVLDFFVQLEREVETFSFADGTRLGRTEVAALALAAQTTSGNDTIAGSWRAEVLASGQGDDSLAGGGAGDTYRYAAGDGRDIIADGGGSSGDVIALGTGILPSTVVLYQVGLNLVIETPGGDQNAILVRRQFSTTTSADKIESITFADGTVWGAAEISAHLQLPPSGHLWGSFTGETLTGGSGADTLFGKAGNDTLVGGGGSDVYVYRAGDGSDAIDDVATSTTDVDVLRLADFTAGQVELRRLGSDLEVRLGGEILTVVDQFSQTNSGIGIDRIELAGGVVWDRATIETNSWYVGTDGDDAITVGSGNTTLLGGLGDDVLTGGAGSDTYVYRSGDGSDTINETTASTTEVDVLRLSGFGAGEVELRRVGSDLQVHLDGEVLTVTGQFSQTNSGVGIDRIELAGGVVWDRAAIEAAAWYVGTDGVDTITVGSGNTTIVGGLGNDVLTGGGGSDVYRYASGDGSDRIVEGGVAGADELWLTDISPTGVLLSRVGTDLMVRDLATGQVIEVDNHFGSGGAGVESLRFGDGTVWDRTQIAANTWISGTTGVDNIGGSTGSDNLFGDLGDDILQAGAGGDVYLYRSGDGSDQIEETSVAGVDVLRLTDLDAAEVMLTRTGADLYVRDMTTGQAIRVNNQFSTASGEGYGIETLQFADGVVWGRAEMTANVWVMGTSAADNLGGTASNDRMFGDLGNDTLQGGAGGDVYLYRSGDGADVIEESSSVGADTLHLADLNADDVTLSKVGADVVVRDNATGQTIKLNNQVTGGVSGNGYGVETLRFADGSEWTKADILARAWIRGTTAGENISGTTGDDTLFGDLGVDRLAGGTGADTYVYRSGDGADTVAEDSGVGADTLHLVDLDASEVSVTRVGSDLMIQDLSTGQSIKVEYHFWSGTTGNGYGVETLKFADGSIWSRQQISDVVNGLSAMTTVADPAGKGDPQVRPPLDEDKDGPGAPQVQPPLSKASGEAEPLVQPGLDGSGDKRQGPQVLPPVGDGLPKDEDLLVICWPGPADDFVFKTMADQPLVRPAIDEMEVFGRGGQFFSPGWQLTLPFDGTLVDHGGHLHGPAEDNWLL